MSDSHDNRRSFLKKGAALPFALGAASGGTVPPSEAAEHPDVSSGQRMYLNRKARMGPFTVREGRRPHIFLITADMVSPDCYLPSRDMSRYVNLPNIRSIAGAGMRFDNALCTIPLCGPSRASIFTGRYPPYLTNGERAPLGMKTDLGEDDRIFQEYLRAAGYTTKHVGKCHVGTHKFMDAFGENDDAWNRWAPPLMDDDDYVAFLAAKGVKPPRYRKELRGKGFDRTAPGNSLGGWIEQADGSDFPLEAHYSVYLAEKAVAKLDAALQQAPDSPAYIQLDFFDPHQPYSIPSGLEQRAEELRHHVRLHPSYERVRKGDFQSLPDEPPVYDVYRRYWGAYDPDMVTDYMIGHFLQMEVVDHAAGLLLGEIRRRGLWDDSMIVFMADHGEMNGRLALFDKGVYFQPDIFRVPLAVKLHADAGQRAGIYDRPVSALDVCPTILAQAGIAADDFLDGVDLTPVLNGTGERPSLGHIVQTGWHVGVNYGVGINHYESPGRHWFYGCGMSGGEEDLYNIAVDECINLAADHRYKDVRLQMIRQLADVLKSDPRWLGYWSTFRLLRAEELPGDGGDMQMFVPAKDSR